MKKRERKTLYDICLVPLLKEIGWQGTRRQLKEAMPHYTRIKNPQMFSDVIKNLNFELSVFNISIEDLDARLCPCLFVSKDNEPLLIISKENKNLKIFNPATKKTRDITLSKENKSKLDKIHGTVYSFKRIPSAIDENTPEVSWMRKNYINNRPLIHGALFLSLFLSLFALATPLFIMFTYNFVIKSLSTTMLWQFSIGVILALIGFFILSRVRARQLSIVGARFDRSIGDHIFERLLYLSPRYTESASVGSQVARLRDFSRLREFVTGPLMATFFDMPFMLVGLVIIAALGGWLVIIPVIAIVFYFLSAFFLYRESQRRLTVSGLCAGKEQGFILEAITKLRAIKYTASTEKWLNRYSDLASSSALANVRNAMIVGINDALSDVVTIGTGMLVLGFGAIRIIDGSLSSGALLAVMILSWRILAPLKTIFNIYPRVLEMRNSLEQITRLMKIKPEEKPSDVSKAKLTDLKGRITFNNVSFRYPDTYTPALLNVNFDLSPGQGLAITGRNGSGKSSILRLILRMCEQQSGSILLDSRDIRQFNEIELRSRLGYLQQNAELFHGTVLDNIRLSDPGASMEAARKAAKEAGILEVIESLPDGFYTYLHDYSESKLPASFSQELCIARALIKRSPVLLLDEPTTALDHQSDKRLLNTLASLKGKLSIIIITHRPSYMKLMDRTMVLDEGKVLLEGTSEEVLDKIAKEKP